jgi:hypothetical protein
VTLSAPSLASRIHNATLRIRGEHFAFEPADPAQALARFRRSNALRQQAWWRRARRFGQRLVGRAERQLQGRFLARWRQATDDALLERSAQALAAAARGPSYLSDDSVFRDRLDTLQSRLEFVRAAAKAARLDLLPASAQSPDAAGDVRHARLPAMVRGGSPV